MVVKTLHFYNCTSGPHDAMGMGMGKELAHDSGTQLSLMVFCWFGGWSSGVADPTFQGTHGPLVE